MNRLNARWTTGFAALALALGAAGCGDKLLGITASIVVSPTMLAFGQAQARSTCPSQITASPSSPTPAAARRWSSTPSRSRAIRNNEPRGRAIFSSTIAATVRARAAPRSSPGECAQFTVIWSPTAVHAAAGAVEVDLGADLADADHHAARHRKRRLRADPGLASTIRLRSDDQHPATCTDLTQSPPVIPTVAFGNGTVNTPVTQKIRVTNIGQAPLTLIGAAPDPTIVLSPCRRRRHTGPLGERRDLGARRWLPARAPILTLTATPTTSERQHHQQPELHEQRSDPRRRSRCRCQIFVAGAKLCVDADHRSSTSSAASPSWAVADAVAHGEQLRKHRLDWSISSPSRGYRADHHAVQDQHRHAAAAIGSMITVAPDHPARA